MSIVSAQLISSHVGAVLHADLECVLLAVISNPKVAVVHDHPFKGRAVVAREDLPPHTFVGIYGGNIYLTREYSAMMDRGGALAAHVLLDFCCWSAALWH